MPIKFRCPHCRQFLGVSRAKAGSLADCPSCGRSLRIPQLDGKVEKVSTPDLDLNNAGLRKALDSLAQLAVSGAEVDGVETYADEHAEMPVPHPEAEPNVPLVAVAPKPVAEDHRTTSSILELPRQQVADELPLESNPSTAEEHHNGSVSVTPTREVIKPAATPNQRDAFVPSLAALAKLAEVPDAASPPAMRHVPQKSATIPPPPRPETLAKVGSALVETRSATSLRSVPRSKASLVVTSLVSLLIGGGIGASIMQSLARHDIEESNGQVNPSNEVTEPVAPAIASGPVGLTGRVNYVDQDGQSRPDDGARVLVLPAERTGTALLPADAFRSGANDADRRIAEAALAAMGGAFVIVSEDGEYSAALPSAARFHVLILSQHMANDLQGGHAAELLADYVDRPNVLLGRVAWTVYPIRHPGSGSQSVDHTFVPPQGE